MKKTLIFLIFVSACVIHAQTDDKENLKILNQKIQTAYQKSDLDEALKYAKQALDLNIKLYGAEHKETAVAYTNIGIVLKDKKKYKDAVQPLQNAVAIYRKEPVKDNNTIARLLDILAETQISSGDAEGAEKNALESLKILEDKYGKESKQALYSNLSLGKIYARTKNKEKASESYLKSYVLAVKVFGINSKEIEAIDDSRACSDINWSEEKNKRFVEAKEKLLGNGQGEIINGKAKKLGVPYYPAVAKARRVDGAVAVKILVDEQGKPTEIKAICGDPVLRGSSEAAAGKSEFEPTLVNGIPIKVRGYIIFRYVL